jgi:hypothetical protein
MNRSLAILLLPGLLLACVQPQPVAAPPPPAPVAAAPVAEPVTERFVGIRAATCDTLLGLSADDRSMAAMFYIGYEANRYRSRAIDVTLIPTITGLATDYCQAEPGRTVASVFAQAYAQTRGW